MLDKQKFYNELEILTNIDSGSYCADGVTQVASWFATAFESMGWESTWYDPAPGTLGKSVFVAPKGVTEMDLLILCHVDTVFPAGEVAKRPFTTGENRIFGPGVADMKAGCLFTLYSLQQLIAEKSPLGRVGVFFNGEHEISCPNMRSVIEEYSKKSRIVIAAEPTRANGNHVKRRKGILRYTVAITGKAAHAGNNPEDGVCAVTEMANWALFFKSLENPAKGITINNGVAKGGTSVNSIPDSAELKVDMRVSVLEDAFALEKAVAARGPFNPQASVKVTGGITRPPMVPNEQTEELCTVVEQIGREVGIDVTWASVGGGSDASFASAMGKPALCGMGPAAGKLHTQDEFIDTRDLEKRFLEFKTVVQRFSLHAFTAA